VLDTVVEADAPMIELDGQQLEAVNAVRDWYGADDRQTFRLFGYAGTGKTTLARYLVDALGLDGRTRFATFTGKAAHVLTSSGCDAQTIHSLIYQPVAKAREHLHDLQARRLASTDPAEQRELDDQIAIETVELDQPGWIVNSASELRHADLLVLDEVSMVDDEMARDLLDFDVPTLVLGDPAQLPPISGAGYFVNSDPDLLLTEIHRSALDSPVTRLATAVREADGTAALGVPGMDGDSGRWHRALTAAEALRFDQVICWRNKTRWQIINSMRSHAGYSGDPRPGERIIGLVNDRESSVLNGEQFTVLSVQDTSRSASTWSYGKSRVAGSNDESRVLDLVVRPDGEQREPMKLRTWAVGFTGEKGEVTAKRASSGQFRTRGVVAATFAHAITVHKAQGSQWGKVLVVDETAGLRSITGRNAQSNGAGPEQAHAEASLMAKRWMYTAITRARKQVILTADVR
jgi:exodeoxyribonuclease-5